MSPQNATKEDGRAEDEHLDPPPAYTALSPPPSSTSPASSSQAQTLHPQSTLVSQQPRTQPLPSNFTLSKDFVLAANTETAQYQLTNPITTQLLSIRIRRIDDALHHPVESQQPSRASSNLTQPAKFPKHLTLYQLWRPRQHDNVVEVNAEKEALLPFNYALCRIREDEWKVVRSGLLPAPGVAAVPPCLMWMVKEVGRSKKGFWGLGKGKGNADEEGRRLEWRDAKGELVAFETQRGGAKLDLVRRLGLGDRDGVVSCWVARAWLDGQSGR